VSEAHRGSVALAHTFDQARRWLVRNGPRLIRTEKRGTPFRAEAWITEGSKHQGEKAIRFTGCGPSGHKHYSYAYSCCWGQYLCDGTRIGMYCTALDKEMS